MTALRTHAEIVSEINTKIMMERSIAASAAALSEPFLFLAVTRYSRPPHEGLRSNRGRWNL
ncbi:uncharacterized protein METZ01_LOCUS415250 [marine metagenome]|uniref:Uncharacterized protein n=1 Tax=marine metagenome TaxID=408172 RepID=A0A382WU58_9ZZZZ